ncbi:MAG: hypothetical protein KBT36_05090 [Kurthia sp.]|nr:hypothetical protein [Candidatus Kurthia equi]
MSKVWRRVWLIIGLVTIIALIVNEFTSNPYAEYRAKVKLETYLNEKYPDRSFEITDGNYNSKKDLYSFTVKDKFGENENYSFEIENGHNYTIVQDRLKESEIDEEVSKRLSIEASNSLKELVEAKIPYVRSVTASVKVPKRSDGIEYASWQPSFESGNTEAAAKILMDFDVSGMDEKDMYAISNQVYTILQQADVNYSTATLTGYKVGGKTGKSTWDYEYKLEFDKNNKPKANRLVVVS